MINFAHRGASGDYPENTLLAFEEGIKCGASGIELDVHKTKDNKIVVIHDEDIERTFKGKGLVKDFTLNELKEFNPRKELFKNFKTSKIPTLEEVLNLIKNSNVILNIELKTDEIHYEGIEEDVINLINKYKMNNKVIISSFNPKSIKICKEINEEIKTGLLYYKPMEDVIEFAKSLKADAIHPDLRLVSKELIDEAHKNNLEVNVYTVDAPIYMRKLIEAKADGIFTNYPALLDEIMKEEV
nr:glycerophosphodiester phosphodiesterase [uncultured Clostridium sp.]